MTPAPALAELGAELSDIRSAAELGRIAAGVLDRYRADLPFALVYLADDSGHLTLSGFSGTTRPPSPARRACWPR
ncbi:hypothetical protein NKG94_25275 [Micromonospora sp. M12]